MARTTRRGFLSTAAYMGARAAAPPLTIPINQVIDSRIQWGQEKTERLWSRIWLEAVRDFGYCGIDLQSKSRTAEVGRSPSGQPEFDGLEPRMINLVVTDHIPLGWDKGRGVVGVTTLYRGYHLCMVGLRYAHCHQIPLLSVNTCVHELLHALLHDIFEKRPTGFLAEARELRIDLLATRLWLLHDGETIRKAAQTYVERLRS